MSNEKTRLRNILQKIQTANSLTECKKLYQSANINWTTTLDKWRKKEAVEEGKIKLEMLSQASDKVGALSLGTESEVAKKKLTQFSDEKFDFFELVFNEFTNLVKWENRICKGHKVFFFRSQAWRRN